MCVSNWDGASGAGIKTESDGITDQLGNKCAGKLQTAAGLIRFL